MDEFDGTQELPEEPVAQTEAPIIDFNNLLYNEYRIALMQRWANIIRFHEMFGCPLDAEGSITAAACVVHGTPADRRELTEEEFLGTFAPELLPN